MSDTGDKRRALYQGWLALGTWIGNHLMIIVPAGVAIGIIFPELLLPVKPFVPTLFAIMTLQNSLKNNLGAMRHALRRPLVLVTVLLLVHLLMPLAAFGISSLIFGPDSPTVAGVVLEYSVPIGASTVMWVGMFSGELPLCLSTLLVSTLISPFTIPATLQLLVGTTVEVDALGMMGNMAYMIAFPALIATVINELSGGRVAKTVAPATTPVSRILLPIIVATNATALASYARNPEPRLLAIMAVMLAFAVSSFLLGMLVASKLSDDRASFVAMSFSCGIRNVTAGAVLATQYFGPEVMFPAIIGTPFQQLLAALFGRIMERRLKRRYPTEDDPQET
ncbi:MAG: bile acid:sodium symporter family protein [Coriobacteriales bacterium]|nr:bile acid:sodium symporter family protein [Coriobacteriales bacterium]